MLIKEERASESTHWYAPDGSTAYQVQAKDGSWRNTTLRDARKLNLSPSVTTVMGIMAKPGLESWKLQNTVMAAMTLPRLEGESLDDFAVRVIQDSKETAQKAAQLGTDIHASLDKAYSGLPYDPSHEVYVKAVHEAVFLKYGNQEWLAEKSFAHPLGFGGKVDLHSPSIVIDFKTSSFTDPKKVGYEEHLYQLAAYAKGLNIENPILANVYVSTSTPGLVVIKEWEDTQKGLDVFLKALELWQAIKGYKPS